MQDLFDAPASAAGVKWEDLSGMLVLVKPTAVENGINTVVGVKDAIVADVHIIEGAMAGTVYNAAFIFPKVLQSQIRSNVGTGRFNLGRVGKGVAKPGQNAPWMLTDPTAADAQAARDYLAKAAAAPATAPPAASAPGGNTSFTDAPF